MAGASSSSSGPAGQGSTLRADAPAFVPKQPAGAPAAAGSARWHTEGAAAGPASKQQPRRQQGGGGGSGDKKQGGTVPATPPKQSATNQTPCSKPDKQQKPPQPPPQQRQKGGKPAPQAQPPAAGTQRRKSKAQAQPSNAAAKPPKAAQGNHGKSSAQQTKVKSKRSGAGAAAAAAGAQGSSSAPSAPSFAALPPDLLRRIFSAVLPSSHAPKPLLQVAQQWFALRRVCRSWAAVLDEDAPSSAALPVNCVAVLPVPAAVPWLHRHATSLRLAPPPARAIEERPEDPKGALEWLQARCGRLHRACATRGERSHPVNAVAFEYGFFVEKLATGRRAEAGERRNQLTYLCKFFLPLGTTKRAAKEGSLRQQAVLELSALTRLQALELTWGPPWEGLQPHTFDCARLRHLPALRSLILHEFAEPCLAGLPSSLRRLTIDGGWSRGGRTRPTAFFTLPHHSSLERVRVVGYQRDYFGGALELPAVLAGQLLLVAGPDLIDEENAVEVFHYRSRFKVNLGSLCSHSQEVVTDAQLLHLGLPCLEAASLAAVLQPSASGSEDGQTDWWEEEEDDEDEQGLWPPVPAFAWAPDRGMAVHLSHRDDHVVAVVDALAAAIGSGSTRLRRLQVRTSAFFVLASGALVPVRLLDTPAGRRALQKRWPGLQLLPAAVHHTAWDWLVLTWPPN